MKTTQLHEFVNSATQSVLGEQGVLQEDFSNLVDIGDEIQNLNKLDTYVKKLVDRIGKVLFVNRVYAGNAPSVLMDSWEFGSILQKIDAELPNAEENDSWNLTHGETYDQDKFYQPTVNVKFFNDQVTFDVPLSFTERQLKQSFASAGELNAFVSMLNVAVENSMTVKLDGLIMRTIANMAAETLHDGSGIRAVNLLEEYNSATGNTLAASEAIAEPAFIRYATYLIGLYTDRMVSISKLFNVEGKERFTPRDAQKLVLLSDFAKASETFLLSTSENEQRVTLPNHDAVPYWQGSGESYAFDDVSRINAKLASDPTSEVNVTGVLGVLFDRNALGVTNLDRRVTTHYNARAEFYNNFYKFDAGYFNDLSENFIVFYMADPVDG